MRRPETSATYRFIIESLQIPDEPDFNDSRLRFHLFTITLSSAYDNVIIGLR